MNLAYWKEKELSACSKASKATAVQYDSRELAEAGLIGLRDAQKDFGYISILLSLNGISSLLFTV